jgi:hypothetical protein
MRITEKTLGPWTPVLMKAVLLTNQEQREKALLKLFSRQTIDEQQDETTKYHNNVGFNGCDAKILTGLATFFSNRKYLTEKQQYRLTKKIVKYSGQLSEVANIEWACKNTFSTEQERKDTIKRLRGQYLNKYKNVINDLIEKKETNEDSK